MDLFKIHDITGRAISLSTSHWNHITSEHKEVRHPQQLIEALQHPTLVVNSAYDSMVRWFYRHNKQHNNFLFVAVKYLNHHGYIITAYNVRRIR